MRRGALVVLLAATATAGISDPAVSFQTETDRQGIHLEEHRLRVARRDIARARAAERRAVIAAAAAESEPVVSAPTSYPAGVLSAAQVASYADAAGFPADVVPTMVAIAYRESRFNPGAVNPSSGACGLWQMYPCPGSHALDPATNAAMAFDKWSASGLSPWGY